MMPMWLTWQVTNFMEYGKSVFKFFVVFIVKLYKNRETARI